MTEVKQVIAARTDIGMGKGKLAAQVAHASLAAVETTMHSHRDWYQQWMGQGQATVVVRVESEAELIDLMNKAKSAGLPTALIKDRGLTQVEPGTSTCLGVGPAPVDMVDRVTGQLRLL